MIRIILVLSLLNLAIPSKIPIHKQIVGAGGENIDVNIEVNIDLPEDDTTGGESTPGPPASCLNVGAPWCQPTDGNDNKRVKKCCKGSTCVREGMIFYCKETPLKPTNPPCKKEFMLCTGDNTEDDCCGELTCVTDTFRNKSCFNATRIPQKPTEPTCLKTGDACAPKADKKCCPTNLCDLDNLKCVRVQEHPENPLVS